MSTITEQGNDNRIKVVLTGGYDQIKASAIKRAFSKMELAPPRITGVSRYPNSKECAQLSSFSMIKKCAFDQITFAEDKLDSYHTFYISFETGLTRSRGNTWVDRPIVMVSNPSTSLLVYRFEDKGIQLPLNMVMKTMSKEGGFFGNSVYQSMLEVGFIKSIQDPYIDLIGESRESILSELLFQTLNKVHKDGANDWITNLTLLNQ